MRIGLLSDTHISVAGKPLPPRVAEAFRGVDLILHAGDIYVLSVLDELQNVAPVLAASGDDDYGATLADERVKQKHVLNLQGLTLWLVHERPYHRLFTPWQTIGADRPVSAISFRREKPPQVIGDEAPDIVVFGHEHRTVLQRAEDMLLVNPGSPTLLHYQPGLGTVAILEMESGEAQVRILQL